jgi:hypothetical protein
VIIDDNSDVYKGQMDNCISIVPFDIFKDHNKEDDNELHRIKEHLLSIK